jgi:nicotianamine synthase
MARNDQDSHKAMVARVFQLYDELSQLGSLKPSTNVDTLFSQLVGLCAQPSNINVRYLSEGQQEIRSRLIRLCAEAEGLLEKHYSARLGRRPFPLHHLGAFPYYNNYLKLARLEFETLRGAGVPSPKRVAFLGSGPLPLTSIVLALHHLPSSRFDNYDFDPAANAMARLLVAPHHELARRMAFLDAEVEKVTAELREYDVVFLAALVGIERAEKARVVKHLGQHMAPGAVLLLRSAHGARAFLYPVVEVEDLPGFDVLSVVHPTDEVINSVILARKRFNDPE